MTFGALLFSAVVWLVLRPALTPSLWFFGILGGVLWSVGQNYQFQSMKYMGVSVANPLSSGAQLLLGSLIGEVVFKEWFETIHFVLGIPALLLLVTGFYFISKKDVTVASDSGPRDYKRGFLALIYSTAGYLSFIILFNNILSVNALVIIFPMAIGMVIGAISFMHFNVEFVPVVLKNMIVGVMWALGNVFMFLSAAAGGLAIAFSFSQLGVIISVIGGILFLGETKNSQGEKMDHYRNCLFCGRSSLARCLKSITRVKLKHSLLS